MAKMAMAQLWLRHCRAVHSVAERFEDTDTLNTP